MASSKMERLRRLLAEDFEELCEEIKPQGAAKPALTDQQLYAAAPDSTRPPNAPLDLASLDMFHGIAYVNKDLELVGISSSDDEADPVEEARVSRDAAKPSIKQSSNDTRHSEVTTRADTSGEPPATIRAKDISEFESPLAPSTFDQETGGLATVQSFVPIVAFSKFPYKYVRQEISEKVADLAWNAGKFWERSWDIYYIWPSPDQSKKPVLLISLAQAEDLLREVNEALPEANIALPSGAREVGLRLDFAEYPHMQPRFLRRSTSRSQYNEMEQHVPPRGYKPAYEPNAAGTPDDRSLEAFKAMMDLAMSANKAKQKVSKTKKKEAKISKQRSIGGQLKTIERHLGLRPKRQHLDPYNNPDMSWEQIQEAERINDEEARMKPIRADEKAQYPFEDWVVFVCVDVEAYERANHMITEIGVSTLDTWDVKDITPGKNGDNWDKMIRKRHFLIQEHAHLVNSEFLTGCPDRFEFGESEVISKHTAPQVVASCFKYPFSGPEVSKTDAELMQKAGIDLHERMIVFVGHDVEHDVVYLQKLGYNPLNLRNLHEYVDTAQLYRYLRRAANTTSLGSILYELDMTGWNLHNAGNDAAYTLHAMLAIAVRHCEMRGSGKAKEEFTEAYRKREEELVNAARERAKEEQEGWDSDDEDGGLPLRRKDAESTTKPGK